MKWTDKEATLMLIIDEFVVCVCVSVCQQVWRFLHISVIHMDFLKFLAYVFKLWEMNSMFLFEAPCIRQ